MQWPTVVAIVVGLPSLGCRATTFMTDQPSMPDSVDDSVTGSAWRTLSFLKMLQTKLLCYSYFLTEHVIIRRTFYNLIFPPIHLIQRRVQRIGNSFLAA